MQSNQPDTKLSDKNSNETMELLTRLTAWEQAYLQGDVILAEWSDWVPPKFVSK